MTLRNVACLLFLLVFLVGAPLAPLAMDAELERSEKTTVRGSLVIRFDPAVNGDVLELVAENNRTLIYIDMVRHLPQRLKNFAKKAIQENKVVDVTGELEYWSDGTVVFAPHPPLKYKVAY